MDLGISSGRMQDLVAGFLAAPLWAQAGMALFGIAVVVTIVGPRLTQRRYARRFGALAAAAGMPTTRRDEFTESFTIAIDGRPFEVRRELRVRGRGSSYRGPTGHLLVTSTALSGGRWQMHGVDITPGRVASLFGEPPVSTGDPSFDSRFVVMQDGVPVRDGWLDAPTRDAITSFFETPVATGPVWVQAGQLQHVAAATWGDLDLAALTRLLRRQAELAGALERTAGWRGSPA